MKLIQYRDTWRIRENMVMNIRKQLCMDMFVITQLYYQLYIKINYMFRPILFLAIIRLDTTIGENYTIYNMIQYNHQCWCKYVTTIIVSLCF